MFSSALIASGSRCTAVFGSSLGGCGPAGTDAPAVPTAGVGLVEAPSWSGWGRRSHETRSSAAITAVCRSFPIAPTTGIPLRGDWFRLRPRMHANVGDHILLPRGHRLDRAPDPVFLVFGVDGADDVQLAIALVGSHVAVTLGGSHSGLIRPRQ